MARTPSTALATHRTGFSLLELFVALVIIVVLAAILLPSLGRARLQARSTMCMSNERMLGTCTISYAFDFKDRFPAFTWTASPDAPLKLSQFDDLNGVTSPVEAAASQTFDILRRRTGRVELNGRVELERPKSWQPYLRHHPLVMIDYLASRLPEKILACPNDEHLIRWQNAIPDFDAGAWGDQQPAPDAAGRLAPYGTTYQPTISMFDVSPEGSRLAQGERSSELVVPGGDALAKSRFTGGVLGSVVAPSSKVLYFHEYGLHERAPMHFGLDASRQPLVFVDGSARSQPSADANPGWQPNKPMDPAPSTFLTDSFAWNPATLASQWSGQDPPDRVIGKFRWTREGLGGVDVGGKERMPAGAVPRGVPK